MPILCLLYLFSQKKNILRTCSLLYGYIFLLIVFLPKQVTYDVEEDEGAAAPPSRIVPKGGGEEDGQKAAAVRSVAEALAGILNKFIPAKAAENDAASGGGAGGADR